jgi:branched-chain amino acid transport system ATP-binding protein
MDGSGPRGNDGSAPVVPNEVAPAPVGATVPASLTLRDVSVRFGGVHALEGVSLSMRPGELLGLIGPNGAGKTTLFDVISGVRRPYGGSVVLANTDITSWSTVKRARAGIRRTFQQVHLFGWLSVTDNVLAALDWRGGGGGAWADLVSLPTRRRRERARRHRVDEVLHLCGLTDLATRSAASLPIGQARAVELARAIAEPPTVLLLDEPNSGLDHAESERLALSIERVRTESSCSVLLVEHDMDFVMNNCDRVVVLNLGSVLMHGSPEEVRSDPGVRTAYLGTKG